MGFCYNCGAQVDSSLSYCLNCGTNLREVRPPSRGSRVSAQVSMKERGGELEDAVTGYFRAKGYDVQTRIKMRDRRDVFHEIDVLASKKEDFTIQVAIECKRVQSPIGIEQVRNFESKLTALGITKGIMVSTGGFTVDAESQATSVGIDLWDQQELDSRLAELQAPEEEVLQDALPVHRAVVYSLVPRHLRNFMILSQSVQVSYRPFFFVDYNCFTQHTIGGDSVILESKGTVVVDGVGGRIVDSRVTAGQEPQLPRRGAYVGCIGLQPQTITSINMPDGTSVIPPTVDLTRARDIAKVELVKGLSLEHYTTRTTKIVKPNKKDIDILNIKPLKIPLLTGTYRYRNYTYTRICLASTGAFVLDQTGRCLLCSNQPVVVCGNCGAIVCESHMRACSVCAKSLCTSCVKSKGIMSKTFYCPEHQPRQ